MRWCWCYLLFHKDVLIEAKTKPVWATFFHHEFHVHICLETAPTEPALLLNLFSDSLLSDG